MAYKWVEYMCSYCGTKTTRSIANGRPMPGNCTRKPKTKDGRCKPHSWTVSRRW